MADRKRRLEADKVEAPFPLTFSLMTYNLWKSNGEPTSLELRRPVLVRQLARLQPDVLMVQELHPKLAECVNEALPHHQSVGDKHDSATDLETGWFCEGNIFWRSSLFSKVEHGAVHIGHKERDRRLFWVRLLPVSSSGATLLFATAHFTWQGHPDEKASDINLRKDQVWPQHLSIGVPVPYI